jgi:hypothetical protein
MRNGANDEALSGVSWFATLVLLVLICSSAFAQSGRRAPRTLPTTNSGDTTSNEKRVVPSRPELSRKVAILVARQPTSKHLAEEDVIYGSFIKRLNEFASVTGTALGDVKRSDSVKRAQAESESYVVLLRFDVDDYQNGTILINSHDLIVDYYVFAPRTGKQESKGKVYFQAVGGGRLRKSDWPSGTPIKITPEAAGIDAAEQLHGWLLVTVGVKQKI